MKQVVVRRGKALTEEIPSPSVDSNSVLVKVDHSCISIGTELAGLAATGMSLWQRLRSRPEQLQKGLHLISEKGLSRAREEVKNRLEAPFPSGYSAAGIVTEVGADIKDLKVGDHVACAGAQYAHHAELIAVPRNLVVKIPDGVSFADASTVTLGAIALQGVRRASPTLGETFVVVGLGILGQLTVQLLRANGCRVIGFELSKERTQLAHELGMDFSVDPSDPQAIEKVQKLTEGFGADGVIITAAGKSNEIISSAFKMCRKKGRVVLVGDVGLDLKRSDFYVKEIDFLISTSYGPGRYDSQYEEKGLDYPISYVRWTENRNLSEYLKLIDGRKIKLDRLIQATYPIDRAEEAYAALESPTDRPLMVLLSYPADREAETPTLEHTAKNKPLSGKIGVAVVGAGGFAKAVHLPNLRSNESFKLIAVNSRNGLNATSAAQQFEANYSTTDFARILSDAEVQLVVLTTRHNLHAGMTLQALKAGKNVLVEKPLAIAPEELNQIKDFFQNSKSSPMLVTGFNRRFSPHITHIEPLLAKRSTPMIINYRMNAGFIPLDHWVHGSEGGGRNIGEACHIYDLFTALTKSKAKMVNAFSISPKTSAISHRDNFVVTINFEDGSVATLTYTALGNSAYPKEHMEIFVDGSVIHMTDFKETKVFGAKLSPLSTKAAEKGQVEELSAIADSLKSSGDWPIPLWQQLQATEISFAVESQLTV